MSFRVTLIKVTSVVRLWVQLSGKNLRCSMEQQIELRIIGQLDQISRQLEKLQLSLNRLANQNERQEPGLTEGIKKTRAKVRN